MPGMDGTGWGRGPCRRIFRKRFFSEPTEIREMLNEDRKVIQEETKALGEELKRIKEKLKNLEIEA